MAELDHQNQAIERCTFCANPVEVHTLETLQVACPAVDW